MGANRNLPLAYRPEEYDDWGTIRFAPDEEGRQRYALKVQLPTHDETVLNEHRTNGTDPCEELGRSVVTAINNHAALKEVLKDTSIHLIAAISLLQKLHSDLAPSKKHALFNTKIGDYNRSVDRARAALSAASASETGKEG